jgi:porin
MVFDPDDRTDKYWVDGLFSNGVNLSLGATWAGKAFERTTSINLTGIYSTKDSVKIAETLLPPELRTGTENGAFNVSLKVSHLLLESAIAPGQGLGFYAKAAIADGDPNPFRASFSGGFAGHRIVPGRPLDNFGIGYYYYHFSRDLRSAIAPLINLKHEQGFEFFYNFAVTPWFRVTADLQRIDPFNGDNDPAWIGGVRANITF